MAACQLVRRGVLVRIIDRGPRFSNLSRALAVQARTLEVFAQMGLAEEAIQRGERIQGLMLLLGRSHARFEITGVGTSVTPYPFALLLPQDQTERLLADELERHRTRVEWDTELLSVEQDGAGVSSTVQKTGGPETIRARYLIGADGAHSAVRHALGIDFVGAPYEHRFYLADVCAKMEMPRAFAVVAPGWDDFNGLFPMPGGTRYRLLGVIPEKYRDVPVDFGLVQKILGDNFPIPVSVSDPTWVSEYRLHHRHATSFQLGRCFLAGDAGHIHSPAGGQGMNTGLLDAHNLSWKLASVLKQGASAEILRSYEQERLPFARQLVRGTDRLFSIGTSARLLPRLLRRLVLPWAAPLAGALPFVRRAAFRRISQTGISYRKSPLSTVVRSRWSGLRLPHVWMTDGRTSLALVGDDSFYLLILGSGGGKAAGVSPELSGLVRVHLIDTTEETQFARAIGMKRGMLLVRPDQYVAFSSKKVSWTSVHNYFISIKYLPAMPAPDTHQNGGSHLLQSYRWTRTRTADPASG